MQDETRLGFTAFWILSHRALPPISPFGLWHREVPWVRQAHILKHIALKSTAT